MIVLDGPHDTAVKAKAAVAVAEGMQRRAKKGDLLLHVDVARALDVASQRGGTRHHGMRAVARAGTLMNL